MEKVNFDKFLKNAKVHASVMARGLGRTLYGTAVAGLILIAVYGFVVIQTEEGYAAVFDFIASIATLIIALGNMYLLGSKKRGGKK